MSALRLSERPRLMAGAGVGLAAGAAWLGLVALEHGTDATPFARLAELCLAIGAPAPGAYAAIATMWLLMSIAMMLPTAAPTVDLYARLSRRIEHGRAACIAAFCTGYVLAWGGFGLIAAALQLELAQFTGGALATGAAAGAVLILAGGYQLTPLKAACLTLCRNPLAFFMTSWRDGPRGALAMGFRHGLVCIGCCWALMGLMLVAGSMNLIWMAALGGLMLAEKTLPGADRAGRLVGAALVVAGIGLVAETIV